MKFPDQRFSAVYVIYDADVRCYRQSFIEQMSPGVHMPAGHNGLRQRVREIVASRFEQTEGDEQYDFGYLGKETGNVSYYPYGAVDAEGTYPDDDYDGETGEGQHRKWVGELTRAEWIIFADSYSIDLDDAGYPAEYEETAGSLTMIDGQPVHLEAVSVDNTEGWNDLHGTVIHSDMYISFGYPENPAAEPASPEPVTATDAHAGHDITRGYADDPQNGMTADYCQTCGVLIWWPAAPTRTG